MSGKRFTKPERPRLRRSRKATEQWLILEPSRLAAVGGAFCAVLVLVVNLLRQLLGGVVSPGNVLVAASLTFVVSYTLIGVFVWYLLWVAEKEWPDQGPEVRTIHLEGRRDRAASPESGEASEPTPWTPPAEEAGLGVTDEEGNPLT